jgi:WD40 repeat protein
VYQQLGEYEVLERIGAGGMGEVYRARDPRLGRDVAIKVLPALYTLNADRLQRFQQEARTAGMLNHPNLLTVFELGVHDGAPYIVTELLEGETLRTRLEGGAALAPRKVIDYAIQIANGLAAAHEKGVVHRDLKPENLYLTKDGRVKILDFGLAKLTAVTAGELADVETMKRETAPGTVMGTVGYMAPEQVRGQSVDHRADIFSLGAVLYEMLSGRRAFHGDSSVETMNAILKEDPTELSSTGRLIPPALQRIVEHCLEKSPEARFQSARDLAFHLEAISGSDSGASRTVPAQVSTRRRLLPLAGVILLGIFGAGITWLIASRLSRGPRQPVIHQLSYMRGTVRSARFAPDGQTVIYGGAFGGGPLKVYQTRVNGLESAPMSLPDGDILSIAPNGDLALSIGRTFEAWVSQGTLATAPLLGAAPRPLLEHVGCADWTPDGKELVITRRVNQEDQLEWPMGKALLHTLGYFSHVRVSRDGARIAFLEHPVYDDNRGDVVVADRSGKKTTLVHDWASIEGLAWSPDGREVWFTGDRDGTAGNYDLYGVDLKGNLRAVWRVPGSLMLFDTAADGRVLLASGGATGHAYVSTPADTRERDISWLNGSWVGDLSADGKFVTMASYGAGSGQYYSVYERPTDGSPAVRLGDGEMMGISPDDHWVLSIRYTEPPQLQMLPVGAGEVRTLNTNRLRLSSAAWTPEGKIIFSTKEEHGDLRLWHLDPSSGAVAPIHLTNVLEAGSTFSVSRDSRWIHMYTGGEHMLLPAGGGMAQKAAGFEPKEYLVRWIDGRSAYVNKEEQATFRIDRLDLFTGQRTHVRDIPMPDRSGALGEQVLLSLDGKTYATSMMRLLTDLYVVEGLR